MNSNSRQFLESFIAIETFLGDTSGLPHGVPFTQHVDSLRKTNHAVRVFAEDLKAFARLRNVIVHERGGGLVLAEPNQWAVERIAHIRDVLLQPALVTQFMHSPVWTIDADETLAVATQRMYAQHYSQLPVYENGQYRGILTVRNITYWIGAQQPASLRIDRVQVRTVLEFATQRDTAIFVHAQMPLIDVVGYFAAHDRRDVYLDAVLITQDGKDTQPLLGLIAMADIPAINEQLQLYA
jgi:predicted transcriptional regulator